MNDGALENNKVRNSSIELFRILTMLIIVAHHYVVNSGIMTMIKPDNVLSSNSIFLLLFGWGGKTGINCFVLITGYYMCKSQITLRKFLKLLFEIMFYRILIYAIFLGTGYIDFSIKQFAKTIIPVTSLGTGFTSAYLVFYLFIPFLNILVRNMNKKQHILLMILVLTAYTLLPTMFMSVTIGYVGWFMIIYIIGAYIRIYPSKITENKRICAIAATATLVLSWASVLFGALLYNKLEMKLFYHFVSDANKILALLTAVCGFMLFKNLNLKYSKFINRIAASAFGVLLIHANGNAMRQWLWKDLLKNVEYMNTSMIYIHAFVSVIGIYIVCTMIDMLRVHILEKPFFKWYDKKYVDRG